MPLLVPVIFHRGAFGVIGENRI